MKKLFYILLFIPLTFLGQDNYSLSFDGEDDYVYVPNILNENINSFTIDAHIKVGNANTYQKIIDIYNWTPSGTQGAGDGQGDRLLLEITTNNELQFQISQGNIGQCGNALIDSLPRNEWIHIVAVWSGDDMSIYINNNMLSNLTTPVSCSVLSFPESNLYIGGRYNSLPSLLDSGFEGEISSIRLWNKSLTHEEIQYYMNCNQVYNEQNLIGYWSFNESFSTALDISVSGNHGTIYGDPSYTIDLSEQNCIEGCTEESAFNYNPVAVTNNGSCEYQGCMNPDAINFDETNTIDDVSGGVININAATRE